MPHPLEQKMSALRRDARCLAAIRGSCLAAAAGLGAMLAWGLLDYLVHFQDRGLRILASFSIAGVFTWTAYRLFVAWRRLRPDAELARRVERRFPRLHDRLVSAVEFLHESDDDPWAGSPVLRRAAVERVAAEAAPLDFSVILDRRPFRRAVAWAVFAATAAAVFVAIDPPAARIALLRLANPFDCRAWPDLDAAGLPAAVEPPEVESLAVRLIPPVYTGRAASPGPRSFRASAGTAVEFAGRATRPLRSAVLRTDFGAAIPAEIGGDGCEFSIPAGRFVVERSGAYWFDLTDREGVHGGGDRSEIIVLPDDPQRQLAERRRLSIAELLRGQEDAIQNLADLSRRTLGRDRRELAPPEAAALGELAGRQIELAESLDSTLRAMESANGAAPTVEALQRARESALAGRMRAAAEQIERNQVGQAAAGQKQIAADLREILAVLAGEKQASGGRPAGEPLLAPEGGAIHAAIQRHWGDLPERLRQRLRRPPVEDYPPQYEKLIAEYYRRLAEAQPAPR